MEMPYQIRNAYRDEWEDAMSLAWRTFLRFEADVYSPEGVRNFENFITDSTLYRMFVVGSYQMFVALDGKKIVGMITLRDTTHISLLFVDEKVSQAGNRTGAYAVFVKLSSDRGTGIPCDGKFFSLRG